MRERMAMHHTAPSCSSCHSLFEPIGLALENFDAIGRWRNFAEGGQAIDASGAMPDGTTFNGPAELRQVLAQHPEQFVTVLTEKLLIYALGRGLEPSDASAIRRVVRAAARDQYRFASIVTALVSSTPFRMRAVATTTQAAPVGQH
jgi:hypothetical protein